MPHPIRARRLQKRLTQEDLANLAEVSVRTVQRVEAGSVTPSWDTLEAIAQVLEVSPEELDDRARDALGSRSTEIGVQGEMGILSFRPRTIGTFMLSSSLLFLAGLLVVFGTLEEGAAQSWLLFGAGAVCVAERIVFVYSKEKATPREPEETAGPWPHCPYCPRYRRGSVEYSQPAAVCERGGGWAWCGSCGALYLRSKGAWEHPQPEQWSTFRDEAS